MPDPCNPADYNRQAKVVLVRNLMDDPRVKEDTIWTSGQAMWTDIVAASPPPPPPPRRTAYGVVVPWWPEITDQWAELAAFNRDVGVAPHMIRTNPGPGNVGIASLGQTKAAITKYPGTPIFAGHHHTPRGITLDRVGTSKALQAEAVRSGHRLRFTVGAEIERRGVDPAVFADDIKWWDDALTIHAPNVDLVVCFGGYQMDTFIERFTDPVLGHFKIIAADPYLKIKEAAVQAQFADLDVLNAYAKAHGLEVTWGEYGVERGAGEASRLDRMHARIAADRPIDAPYFHGTGPFDARLMSIEQRQRHGAHIGAAA